MKKILTPLLLSLVLSVILPVGNVYGVKIGDDTQAVSEQPHAGKFTVFNAQDLEAELDTKRSENDLLPLFKDFAISDALKADAFTTFFTQRNLIDVGFAAISYDDLNNQQASLEKVYNATKSPAFAAFLKRQNFPQVSEQNSAVPSVIPVATSQPTVIDEVAQKIPLSTFKVPYDYRYNLRHGKDGTLLQVQESFNLDPDTCTRQNLSAFIRKQEGGYSHSNSCTIQWDTAWQIIVQIIGYPLSEFQRDPSQYMKHSFNALSLSTNNAGYLGVSQNLLNRNKWNA